MTKTLSGYLDLVRWLSAFAVLIAHLNGKMFIPFASVPANDRGVLFYIWTFVCGFGHPAVVIFFTLSGFLVGGKLLNNLRTADADFLKCYFEDRFVRIYLVLIPALVVTFLADMVGSNTVAEPNVSYTHCQPDHALPGSGRRRSAGHFP